jgi:hypothetical protein
MEKTLKYKVVDLVESYNFHVKFSSVRVQTKQTGPLPPWPATVAEATVPRAPTTVPMGLDV